MNSTITRCDRHGLSTVCDDELTHGGLAWSVDPASTNTEVCMKIVITLVCAAIGVGLGVACATSEPTPATQRTVEVQVTGVDCPFEETCEADLDFRGGKWYARVTRP